MQLQSQQAIKVYLDRARLKYVATRSREEALDILERASNLTSLVEYVGLTKEYY